MASKGSAAEQSEFEDSKNAPRADTNWSDSKWNGDGWKDQGKWWNSSTWNADNAWSSCAGWQSADAGIEEVQTSELNQEEIEMDESEKRALVARREVEANLKRMQKKAEHQNEEQRKKEEKAAAEREEREKQKREYIESQEQRIREAREQQQKKKQVEEETIRKAKEEAKNINTLFAPVKAKAQAASLQGGRMIGWAAKAQAAKKGEDMRKKKQDELDRQASEIFANITETSSSASRAGAGTDSASSALGPPLQQTPAKAEPKPRAPRPPPKALIGPRTGLTEAANAGAVSEDEDEHNEGESKPPEIISGGASDLTNAASSSSILETRKVNMNKKKKWWENLDGDCPISLAPLGELPDPPFSLSAEGTTNKHHFDARFLANFLLSSCDFIDPVNRRPLTWEECRDLDRHLAQYHRQDHGEASVADAFALFQRHGMLSKDSEEIHAVQREATAVLQHLFRFRSARRTDVRGRAINFSESALTVVDDDDILAPGANTVSRNSQQPAQLSDLGAYPQFGGDERRDGGARSQWQSGSSVPGRVQAHSIEEFPEFPKAKAKAPCASKAKAKPKPTASSGKGRGRTQAAGKSWARPP